MIKNVQENDQCYACRDESANTQGYTFIPCGHFYYLCEKCLELAERCLGPCNSYQKMRCYPQILPKSAWVWLIGDFHTIWVICEKSWKVGRWREFEPNARHRVPSRSFWFCPSAETEKFAHSHFCNFAKNTRKKIFSKKIFLSKWSKIWSRFPAPKELKRTMTGER